MTRRMDETPGNGDALFVALLEAAPEPPEDFVPGTAAPPPVEELARASQFAVGERGAPPGDEMAADAPASSPAGIPDGAVPAPVAAGAFDPAVPLDSRSAFEQQATFLEDEARHQPTASAAARGLLLASELWAQLGNIERAISCAEEATRAAPSFTLAHGQLRALRPLRPGDADDAQRWIDSLQVEARFGGDEAARSHAACLLSDLLRCTGDLPGAGAAEDLARRASDDMRPLVSQLADRLGRGENPLAGHLPHGSPLRAAALGLAELRSRRVAENPDPCVLLERVRRSLGEARWNDAAEDLAAAADGTDRADALLDLAASMAAHDAAGRPVALRALRRRMTGDTRRPLLRTVAARAVEQGDWAALDEALELADPASGTFDLGERIVLSLIGGGALQLGELDLEALARQGNPALAASLAENTGSYLGTSTQALAAALGSRLHPTQKDELALLLESLPADDPARHVFGTELALSASDPDATVDALERLAAVVALPELHEVVGLLHELAGHSDRAAEAYARAHESAPDLRLVRALADTSGSAPVASLLTGLASDDTDPDRAALLWLEATLQAHPHEALDLLEHAIGSEPVRRVASCYGAFLAARAADEPERRAWLERGLGLAKHPVEQGLWLLRQTALNEGLTPQLRELADRSPDDLALQEHCEASTRASETDRAEHRLRAAQENPAQGPWLSAEATLRAWSAGDLQLASRGVRQLQQQCPSPFTGAFAAMLAHDGGDSVELSESLLRQAAATDPALREEALESLARLDGSHGNRAGRLEWLRALLAEAPQGATAVRAAHGLETELLQEGRVEQLEPAAVALASHLSPGDHEPYRLQLGAARLLDGDLRAARRWLEPLARSPGAPALALHTLEIHARQVDDRETLLWVSTTRGATATAPGAPSPHLLDAALTSARLGRYPESLALLDAVLQHRPDDLLAGWLRWELLGALGVPAFAAGAAEVLASRMHVDAHRHAALLHAARWWLQADLEGTHAAAAEAALRKALVIEPGDATAFEQLRDLVARRADQPALAALLEARCAHASTSEERIQLRQSLATCYRELGSGSEERRALEEWLALDPQASAAWGAHARVCTSLRDYSAAQGSWERCIELTPTGAELVDARHALAVLLHEHREDPENAARLLEDVLVDRPGDLGVTSRLVGCYERLGAADRAITLQTKVIQGSQTPPEKLEGALELARLYEHLAGDTKRALATLERTRKAWPTDPAPLAALARFLERQGDASASRLLVERTTKEVWRKLEGERVEPALLAMLATTAELQGYGELSRGAEAARAAWLGEAEARDGAGPQALDPHLDDLLAPTDMSAPLRTLLSKTGRAFDAAFPVDPSSLAAQPVGSGLVWEELRELSRGSGLGDVELFVTPSLGARCLPARAALENGSPHRMLMGPKLEELAPDQRTFLLLRALKLQQSGAGALARSRSRDSWPMLAALLNLFAPNWVPTGVDQEKFLLARGQLEKGLRLVGYEDDVPFLVLEAIGTLTARAQQLGEAARLLPNRAALLGTGSLAGAFEAFARLGDRPLAAAGPARWRWLNGHAEARDLALFCASRACAELRVRLGLAPRDSLPEPPRVQSLPPRPPQRSLAGVPPRPPPRRR